MARASRPPTLLTLARRLIRDERLLARGDAVISACSGGPDSVAMLHALALLRQRVGFELWAAGIDHGLRAEAPAELDLAADVAAGLEVPFERVRVRVEPGANLQARARRARHQALQRTAAAVGASAIALGHTADDRAETVLLRLLRGAGPRGLAAMPPAARPPHGGSARLVRPILLARRAAVLRHLERHRLPYACDPSNADRRFTRTRVRHELLPLLEQLSPTIVEHLCALAEALDREHHEPGPLASFGRAQRQAIERVLRAGRGRITVRVSGGRDLELRFFRRTPAI